MAYDDDQAPGFISLTHCEGYETGKTSAYKLGTSFSQGFLAVI